MNWRIQSQLTIFVLVLSLAHSAQAMLLFNLTASTVPVEEPISFSVENANWKVITQYRVQTLIPDTLGGIWVKIDDRLVHYHLNGHQKPFPFMLNALFSDNNGGVWIRTDNRFIHIHRDDSEEILTPDNSELPEKVSISLHDTDDNGGIWIATNLDGPSYGGGYGMGYTPNWIAQCLQNDIDMADCERPKRQLIHFHADGRWEVVSSLASNTYRMISDGVGGVWIANGNYPGPTGSSSIGSYSALSHYHADGTWQEIFSLGNYNLISDTLLDGNGGLWVNMTGGIPSAGEGLIHIKMDGSWQKEESFRSLLPASIISFLQSDNQGGRWIGTDLGLIHLQADNTSEVSLLENHILSRIADSGGTWIGTTTGLVHIDNQNQIVGFYTNNSGLPDSVVDGVVSDQQGGLWVNSRGGLAHLTFGQKQSLINQISSANPEQHDSVRQTLLTEKRAALLIQSGDEHQAFMAAYSYRTFQSRGYDNDEIYLLSSQPAFDFNGDAMPDYHTVDAPVTLVDFRHHGVTPRDMTMADIRAAFDWATNQGTLDSPLFVTFIGNGLSGELPLDSSNQATLSAESFNALLEEYQTITGNAVVVIIEASHSGTLSPSLAAADRVIITSTDEGLSYYSDLGRTSFLKPYLDRLRQGDNLWQAWQSAHQTLTLQQTPTLEDLASGDLARDWCLNGCFTIPSSKITLTPFISPSVLKPDQTLKLTLTLRETGQSVRQVWASLMTPDLVKQANEQSLLATPVIQLEQVSAEQWEGHYQFDRLATLGQYTVTFKAETDSQVIAEAPLMTVTLQSQPPYFDRSTNRLLIPAVTVSKGETMAVYQAELVLIRAQPDIVIELDTKTLKRVTETDSAVHFNPDSETVHIPWVEIPNQSGDIENYRVDLQQIPHSEPLQFKVKNRVKNSDRFY